MMQIRVTHDPTPGKVKPDKIKGNLRIPFRGEGLKFAAADNGCIVGPTQSGKSHVIRFLINEFIGPETEIWIFCMNYDICKTWKETLRRLKKKGYKIKLFKSIYEKPKKVGKKIEKGANILDKFLEAHREENGESKKEEKPEEKKTNEFGGPILGLNGKIVPNPIEQLMAEQEEELLDNEGREDEISLPRDSKGREYPKYLFVFDDLSRELRDRSIEGFLKEARHFGVSSIVSSQGWLDLGVPIQRNQYHWAVCMRQLPDKNVDEIRQDLAVPIEPKVWQKLYRTLTANMSEYPYLYLCPINCDYRKFHTEKLNYNDLLAGRLLEPDAIEQKKEKDE